MNNLEKDLMWIFFCLRAFGFHSIACCVTHLCGWQYYEQNKL